MDLQRLRDSAKVMTDDREAHRLGELARVQRERLSEEAPAGGPAATPRIVGGRYDPVSFYERLIELLRFSCAPEMRRQRWRSAPNRLVGVINWVRSMWTRAEIGV